MLISHNYKFIFVHVPKTAGTSITAALQPYSDKPEQSMYNQILSIIGINVNWYGPVKYRRGRKHITAAQIRKMLPDSVFIEYFKFAFVRNPWALLVSYYHFILSDKNHKRHKKVSKMDGFNEYLLYEIKRNKFNQSKFLLDKNQNTIVDYVGKFEELTKDFDDICSKIGILSSIPHHKKSSHSDYRSYYDDNTAQLVADHWSEDILNFGYSFD
jgi:hypothetical protein